MAYLGEKVLANFRPSRSKRHAEKARASAAKRSERPGNCEVHLAALRQCPCVATLKMPAGEVHHLKQGTGERGAGMRSSDRWGIPLSREPHEELEHEASRKETEILRGWGISEPLDLAAALWDASPDVPTMTRIILAHRAESKT